MGVFRTGFFRLLISMELDDLERYARTMEEFIRDEESRLNRYYNEHVEKIEDEEAREWHTESLVDDLYHVDKVYYTSDLYPI